MEIDYDDYGNVIINGVTHSVDEACGLAEELERAIENASEIVRAMEEHPNWRPRP